MKIFRLKLSKARRAAPETKRWIAAAVSTAGTLDTTLTNRRAAPRPQALNRNLAVRQRYARSA